MNAQEIRELFQKYKIPLSRDDVWEVQGTPVVLHKALERLAAVLGVEWGPPQILRAERDEAVLIATGKIADGQPEWSIGEALLGQNYRPGKSKRTGEMVAAYPYAMAEKRAKDRVILKLAGLHGAYSEEESDDFKQGPREAVEAITTRGFAKDVTPEEFGAVPATKDSRSVYVENSLELIKQIQTPEAVSAWLDTEVEKGVWKQYGMTEHQDDGKAILMACKRRRLELKEVA